MILPMVSSVTAQKDTLELDVKQVGDSMAPSTLIRINLQTQFLFSSDLPYCPHQNGGFGDVKWPCDLCHSRSSTFICASYAIHLGLRQIFIKNDKIKMRFEIYPDYWGRSVN